MFEHLCQIQSYMDDACGPVRSRHKLSINEHENISTQGRGAASKRFIAIAPWPSQIMHQIRAVTKTDVYRT